MTFTLTRYKNLHSIIFILKRPSPEYPSKVVCLFTFYYIYIKTKELI